MVSAPPVPGQNGKILYYVADNELHGNFVKINQDLCIDHFHGREKW